MSASRQSTIRHRCRTRPWGRRVLTFWAVVTVALVAGCGSNPPPSSVDPAVRPGYELAQKHGCFACHGEGGVGGAAPKWTGLLGSEVQLNDGSTVIADHDYLVRSIKDPGAQLVSGATLAMPGIGLSDEAVDELVAYIESLK